VPQRASKEISILASLFEDRRLEPYGSSLFFVFIRACPQWSSLWGALIPVASAKKLGVGFPGDGFTITSPLVKKYLTFSSVCAIVCVAPNNITPLGTHPVTVQTLRLSALPITSAVPPGAPGDAWVDEDAASI